MLKFLITVVAVSGGRLCGEREEEMVGECEMVY